MTYIMLFGGKTDALDDENSCHSLVPSLRWYGLRADHQQRTWRQRRRADFLADSWDGQEPDGYDRRPLRRFLPVRVRQLEQAASDSERRALLRPVLQSGTVQPAGAARDSGESGGG